MNKTIAVLPGDGIGPEVINEAVKVLNKIAKKFNHQFTYKTGLIGAVAIDKTGDPLPQETIDICLNSDAVLFGAIGDPKYDDPTLRIRPEQGLLKLRKSLNLYANIRPIKVFPTLLDKSPLKREVIENTDFIVVRELTGGIYFGEKGRKDNGNTAYDVNTYTKEEIIRITKIAVDLALKRRKKITVVDKANVLETSRLWRETAKEELHPHSEIELEFMYVDNASMQIIKNPRNFDIVLTDNMFGDILSDEASVIVGSLGMIPSASLGSKISLYEPIHGSFPKAKGKGTANPFATILSGALMLRQSFGLENEAKAIEEAVNKTLEKGLGTKDISKNPCSTSELGDYISSLISRLNSP